MTPSKERQTLKDIKDLLDANAEMDARQSERLELIETILAPQIKKHYADIEAEKAKKADEEAKAAAKVKADAEAKAKADEEAKSKAEAKKKEGPKPKAKE